METPRWHLRFDQYRRALALFGAIDAKRRERSLSDAEKAGLVQFFNLTVELGWKTLATLLRSQYVDVAMTPMHVVRAAMEVNLIVDGDRWADAVERRNLMVHVYDIRAFDALVAEAGDLFLPLFRALTARLSQVEAEP